MRRFVSLLAVGCLAFAVNSAQASVSYQYVTTAPTTVTVAPGATYTINLYLQESLDGGSTSLITTHGGNGLFGFGIEVARASGLSTINFLTQNTAAAPTGFSGSSSITGTSTDREMVGSKGNSETQGMKTQTSGLYLLGTAQFQATAVAGNTTVYHLEAWGTGGDGIGGNTLTFPTTNPNTTYLDLDDSTQSAGTPFESYTDAMTNGPFNFTLITQETSVPEPSTMVLAGLGLPCLLGYFSRRRRTAAAV